MHLDLQNIHEIDLFNELSSDELDKILPIIHPVKIFEGELLAEFISTVKNRFKSIKRISPQASRKSSSELYLIGKSFIRS